MSCKPKVWTEVLISPSNANWVSIIDWRTFVKWFPVIWRWIFVSKSRGFGTPPQSAEKILEFLCFKRTNTSAPGGFCTASMFNKHTKDTKLTPNLNWRKSISTMTSGTCLRPTRFELLSELPSMLKISFSFLRATWKLLDTFEVLQSAHVTRFRRVLCSLGGEFREEAVFESFSRAIPCQWRKSRAVEPHTTFSDSDSQHQFK